MTSYELIELYDEVLLDIRKLIPYSDGLNNFIKLVNVKVDLSVNYILSQNINSSHSISLLSDRKDEIMKMLTDFADGFDVLKNHADLIGIKQKIESKRRMSTFNNFGEEIDNILLLLDIYSETTQDIYNYIKTKVDSLCIKMLNSIRKATNKYNEIISEYNSLKSFIARLECVNKEEITENEEEIYLHFFNDETTFNSFFEHFSSLLTIYNEFKNLLKSDIELKVIKIESGSFLDKLLGDKNIISLIEELLHKCFDLVYKKYTFEGQLARKTDIMKFIKEELDIIERCKSLGIEISSDTKEVIDKTIVIVSEEVLKLASKSTKVRVNNEIIKIEDAISEKYLLEDKAVLLEDKTGLIEAQQNK
jgi:hypothetical protein